MELEEMLEEARAFIRYAEHKDDWGVPCVYTQKLRKILGMEESSL